MYELKLIMWMFFESDESKIRDILDFIFF